MSFGEAFVRVRAESTGLRGEVEREGSAAGRTFSEAFQRAAGRAGGSMSAANREIKEARTQVRGLEHDVGRAARGAAEGAGAFRHLGRSVGIASVAFLGTEGLVEGLKKSLELGADLQKQQERTTFLFGESSKEVQEFAETAARSLGIGSERAEKIANTFGNMLVPLGVGKQRSAEMSIELTKLAGNIASIRNEDPENVLNKFLAGLRGRGAALKAYGFDISDATLKEEALRQGIVKTTVDTTKAMAAGDKLRIAEAQLSDVKKNHAANSVAVAVAEGRVTAAQAALEKAMAGTGVTLTAQQKALAGVSVLLQQGDRYQGQFAKHSGDLANQQRILSAEFQNLQEHLGQQLLPVATRVLTKITDWLGQSKNMTAVQKTLSEAVHSGTSIIGAFVHVIEQGVPVVQKITDVVGGWKNALLLVIGLKVARWAHEVVTIGLAPLDRMLGRIAADGAAAAEGIQAAGGAASRAGAQAETSAGQFKVLAGSISTIKVSSDAALGQAAAGAGAGGRGGGKIGSGVGGLLGGLRSLSSIGKIAIPVSIAMSIATAGGGSALSSSLEAAGMAFLFGGGLPGAVLAGTLVPIYLMFKDGKSMGANPTGGDAALYQQLREAGVSAAKAQAKFAADPNVKAYERAYQQSQAGPTASPVGSGPFAFNPAAGKFNTAASVMTHGAQKPTRIVIHDTENPASTGPSEASFWKSQGKGYGAHYVVGQDGTIYQLADPTQMTWHTGGANTGSIGIEVAGKASWTTADWKRHPKQLAAITGLVKQLSQAYGIPLTLSTATGISTHAMQSAVHPESQGHWDPGPGFPLSQVLAGARSGSTKPAASRGLAGGAGTVADQYAEMVAAQTGIDARVIKAWMAGEGHPGDLAGYYNYMNIQSATARSLGVPIAGTGPASTAKFGNISRGVQAAVAEIRKLGLGNLAGQTPRQQIAAIAASPWASGHYGGAGGPNLVNTFAGMFGSDSLGLPSTGAGLVVDHPTKPKKPPKLFSASNLRDLAKPIKEGVHDTFQAIKTAAEAAIAQEKKDKANQLHESLVQQAVNQVFGDDPGTVEFAGMVGHADKLSARFKRMTSQQIKSFIREGASLIKQANAQVDKTRGDFSLLGGLPGGLAVDVRDNLGRLTGSQSIGSMREALGKLYDQFASAKNPAAKQRLAEKITADLSDVMSAAATAVQAKQSTFSDAFGRVTDRIFTAFDRATQKHLQAMQDAVSAQIEGMQADLAQSINDAQARGAALTPAEAELKGLQDAHDAAQAARDLSEATKGLADARAGGDAQQIADAQRQLDEVLYNQHVSALERTAQAERAARDKNTDDEITALQKAEAKREKELQDELAAREQSYQDDRDNQRTSLQDQLVDWQKKLLDQTASMTDFVAWLQGQGANGLLKDAELPDPVAAMQAAGEAQGNAFAQGWIGELQTAIDKYNEFAKLAQSGQAPSAGGPVPTTQLPAGIDPNDVPVLDSGGTVSRTGLALVHRGEEFSGIPGASGSRYADTLSLLARIARAVEAGSTVEVNVKAEGANAAATAARR